MTNYKKHLFPAFALIIFIILIFGFFKYYLVLQSLSQIPLDSGSKTTNDSALVVEILKNTSQTNRFIELLCIIIGIVTTVVGFVFYNILNNMKEKYDSYEKRFAKQVQDAIDITVKKEVKAKIDEIVVEKMAENS